MSTELKQSENKPLNSPIKESEVNTDYTEAQNKSSESEQLLLSMTNPNQEADKAKTFAFDINQKIDDLQSHINQLSGGFKRSKGAISHALGDLQSRTSIITGEIDNISTFIEKNDANKSKLMEHMEERFNHSYKLLTEELGGIEEQIQSQYARLNKVQRELNQSYKLLSDRIAEEKQETQHLIEELEKENEEQNKTQRAFSDYLGELQDKSNTTADDVYKLNTELRSHKRLTNKHFKISAASALGITVLLSGAIAYLHSSDPDSKTLITQQIEQELEQHASEMSKLYAPKAITTDEINQLGSHLSTTNQSLSSLESSLIHVQTSLSNQQILLSNSDANIKTSLEDLVKKISALEMSLYGPVDPTLLPRSKISIHKTDWIAQQNPNNYVIQLVGVYRERSVISFANQYTSALQGTPLSTNISTYRGQDWHNLYYGNFASFSEAQAALDKLPASIQSNSPWIRSVSSVLKSAKSS